MCTHTLASHITQLQISPRPRGPQVRESTRFQMHNAGKAAVTPQHCAPAARGASTALGRLVQAPAILPYGPSNARPRIDRGDSFRDAVPVFAASFHRRPLQIVAPCNAWSRRRPTMNSSAAIAHGELISW